MCYFPWAFPFLMRTTLKTVTAAMLKQNLIIKDKNKDKQEKIKPRPLTVFGTSHIGLKPFRTSDDKLEEFKQCNQYSLPM
jgi:hypothetical protein